MAERTGFVRVTRPVVGILGVDSAQRGHTSMSADAAGRSDAQTATGCSGPDGGVSRWPSENGG